MKFSPKRGFVSLAQTSKVNIFIASAVAVAFVVTGIVIVATRAAGTATLSLTPTSATVGLGNTVAVTITENSGTVNVNAVEADLAYDATKLEFVSINTSTSPFNLVARSSGGSGTVYVSSAATAPVTGAQTVAIVTFKAIGRGTSNITFAASSAVVDSSTNTDTLGTTTGATLAVVDATAPSVPTGLITTSRTATSIGLSWAVSTDNVGVAGYNIYRGGTKIGTSTTTSYTDSGLVPSNSYSYTVAAYDAVPNTSAPSTALATSTTADTTNPGTPTSIALTTRTLTSITFHWAASSDDVGVTGYRIYRAGVQIGTSTTTSYTDSGRTPDTTYSYTVAAVDAAGNVSAPSQAVLLTTLADTTAPSVPTNLTSPSQTTSTITLSWTASSDNVGVAGYRVYRDGNSVGTTSSTSFTDTGLTAGTQYSYTVAAYDAAGNTSSPSTARSLSPLLVPGDANGDGHVTIVDLSILASTWQSTTDLRGDFNRDGIVNVLDLSILASNWGK